MGKERETLNKQQRTCRLAMRRFQKRITVFDTYFALRYSSRMASNFSRAGEAKKRAAMPSRGCFGTVRTNPAIDRDDEDRRANIMGRIMTHEERGNKAKGLGGGKLQVDKKQQRTERS